MLMNETLCYVPALALFKGADSSNQAKAGGGAHPIECPAESLPIPVEMLDLFEQMTGWVIGFSETQASCATRQLSSQIKPQSPVLAEGQFSIVDMSATWPADRPTSHRAKCDQFVALLSRLVSELQQSKSDLISAQSTLAAYSPAAIEDDEVELIDSFIPRYENEPARSHKLADRSSLELDSDFEIVAGVEGMINEIRK